MRALGMDGGVEFSPASPKVVRRFAVRDGAPALGAAGDRQPVRRSRRSTGPIFEFGFPDAILQMWAAYLAEREGALGDRLGCVTPQRR